MIKELSEKAKVSVPQGLMPDKWIETYNKILVELVVKECIKTLQHNYAPDDCLPQEEIEVCLKQHFGVN